MEINFLNIVKKYYKTFFIPFVGIGFLTSCVFIYNQQPIYQSAVKIYIKDTGNLGVIYASVKSRMILDNVINKLNLVSSSAPQTLDRAREEISKNLDVVWDLRTGVIEIKFRSTSAEFSAMVPNAIVFELQSNYQELRLSVTKGDPNDFRIIEKAEPPTKAAGPNKVNFIAVSVFLSALVAMIISLFFEYFFHSSKVRR